MAGSPHQRITAAGWSYRSNDQGWLIYRDPRTGLWHTREEAMLILDHSPAADNAAFHVQ